MNDKEFMDYVSGQVKDRLGPLLGLTEDQLSQLSEPQLDIWLSDGIDYGYRSRLDLSQLELDFEGISWEAANEVHSPSRESISEMFESSGQLPEPTIRHYRKITLSNKDIFIMYHVSPDTLNVVGIDIDQENPPKNYPVLAGETLETALPKILDYVVGQNQRTQ